MDWNVAPTVRNNLTVYYNRMANPNIGSFVGVNGAAELGIQNLTTFRLSEYRFPDWPVRSNHSNGGSQNDYQAMSAWGC
jgi:hypothetical protein